MSAPFAVKAVAPLDTRNLALPEAGKKGSLPEAGKLVLPEASKLVLPEAGKLVLPEASKLKVFISYSRDDSKFADQLDAALDLTGFAATIDRHGISGAENWKQRLGALIRDADTVVFVLSPASARSDICAWEVDEAVRLGKRILPVACSPLEDVTPPPQLRDLNYIFFYDEPKAPGSGFGAGLARLVPALNTDLDWIREHTRLLARATEWEASGRAPNRLLFGSVIADAKDWAARRPKDAPEPTGLHLDYIRASEAAETARGDEARQQLERMAAAQDERAKALAEMEEAQKAREGEQRRRARLQKILMAGALATALGFGAFAVFSWNLSQTSEVRRIAAETSEARAVQQTQVAEVKTKEADEKGKEALRLLEQLEQESKNVSLFRAAQATAELKEGDPVTAMLLALDGLPDKQSARPYLPEVEQALYAAWQAQREKLVLAGHIGSVRSAVFSPDGTRVLTASEDMTARLWDSDGAPLATLKGHENRVTSAVFSPDGSRILTASYDKTARLWDRDGQPLATLKGHEYSVTSAVFSPDGSRILTASADDTARLWDTDGQPLATLKGHENSVISAVFSPDGARILTGSDDSTARLWDRDGQPLATLKHESGVLSAVFSPDGSRVLTTSADSTARIWTVYNLVLAGHSGPLNLAVFSPDGRRILTASEDKTARLWDTDGTPLATLEGHTGSVLSAVFSPDGTRILTASQDATARLWDAGGKPLTVLAGHMKPLNFAMFGPDGRIVTASADGTVRVWDADGKALPTVLNGRSCLTAALGQDGHILTASNESMARLWDADGKPLSTLEGHKEHVWSAMFGSDGRIVTASEDRTARIWDAKGRQLAVLQGHTGPVRFAVFSPDGRRILTASMDKTARLWDGEGKLLATFSGHTEGLSSATFGTDGRIVTSSGDKTARVWKVFPATQELVDHVKQELPRCLTQDQRQTFHLAAQAPSWCETNLKWPHDAASTLIRAKAQYNNGDFLTSITTFDEAVRLARAPRGDHWALSVALIGRGQAHDKTKDALAARTDFEEAARLGQDVGQVFVDKGKTAVEDKKYDDAIAAFTQAMQWSSDEARRDTKGRALLGRAEAHNKSENVLAATADFEEAARLGQDVGAYFAGNGEALLSDKKPDEALAAFDEAMRWAAKDDAHRTTRANAVFGRARALDAKQDYDQAIVVYREALALGSNEAAAWLWGATNRLSLQKRDSGAREEALLIALPNYLDLTAAARESLTTTELKSDTSYISSPVSLLHAILAPLANPASSITDCDRLAGHSHDPFRVGDGVLFDRIDATAAIAACNAAIEQDPKQARFFLQRARAHSKAREDAAKVNDETAAAEHGAANVADLKTAMDFSYPIAFNNMAYAYDNGQGVEKDTAKAAKFSLEYFNRVTACCTVPVAKHLLDVETDYDSKTVRRVVHELLLWAAALGDANAHEMLAELYAAGTLEPPAAKPAKLAAAEHLKIAEKLFTAAGETANAQRATGAAAALARDLSETDLATATATATGYTKAAFTASPPWLTP